MRNFHFIPRGNRGDSNVLLVSILGFFLLSCHQQGFRFSDKPDKLFTLIPGEYSGIQFSNDLHYNERFNPYTFHYFYNGAGVAVGDINNDGLPDLFFCSNQGSNKLYLNKGNFQFEDITAKAGIFSDGLWSTGATFADVNGDGLLDIYVCRTMDLMLGWRGNQLYINNGNLTFHEAASRYGLSNQGLSTHAVFFDYDNDGDLDCYLLNNSGREVGLNDLVKDQRKIVDPLGNRLYRNDGDHFTDVTTEAGIYSSKIGFGLGVTIADINKDGWPDIYVSNDFFERDYLYLNKHDGRFEESIEKYLRELSKFSMGADIADINNDGFPDIYVTDMLPEEETRIKSKTQFESWSTYQTYLRNGYYRQFLRNVLQLNRGPLCRGDSVEFHFSEIGRLAGVCATDWSWGSLIADFDNDGYKDIFVANGIYKDVTDQDAMQFQADINRKMRNIRTLIDSLPSYPINKYVFRNNGNLTFTDEAAAWGLDQRGFSNGSAYVDLDNDGDLDLVINNVNMPASIYRNNSEELNPGNSYLKIAFQGEGKNRFGIGAKATVYYNHTLSYQEAVPSRGFESCVDNRLNIGLGHTSKIDSVVIEWQGGRRQVLENLKPNQLITVRERDAKEKNLPQPSSCPPQLFTKSDAGEGIGFIHTDTTATEFYRDRLLFQLPSAQGPRAARGDLNGDGLEDLYICGGKGQAGALYFQEADGHFTRSPQRVFEQDKAGNNSDALFLDVDGDGDLDLLVCNGGADLPAGDPALHNILYLNNGRGIFSRSSQHLPTDADALVSSSADAADFDGDGHPDLFIGSRLRPGKYGLPAKSYILKNDGKGKFTDVTAQVAPALGEAGLVTDGKWFDYDRDGHPDLVLCGEYMPIRLFHNEGGSFREMTLAAGLGKSNGWWNRMVITDLNGDGFPDIVAGNLGLNARFKASEKKPVSMYVSDFDGSGILKQIVCTYNGDRQYPMVLRHDLVASLPYLKKNYLRYADYKGKTMQDIFTAPQLDQAVKLDAYDMESAVFLNDGKGGFTRMALPVEAQFSPIYAISAGDFDGDGKMDLLAGGNFYQAKPETGIYDGSYGLLLLGDGTGHFRSLPPGRSGFFVKGAVRDIIPLHSKKRGRILILKDNESAEFFNYPVSSPNPRF